jgi:hypothetical protein
MTRRCVCGHVAGPHDCPGDPGSPAIFAALEADIRVQQCAECGALDETVMPGGGLCAYCAELSALQAPVLERRLRWRAIRRPVTAAIIGAMAILMAIWLLIAL